jgi:hypothetical protein
MNSHFQHNTKKKMTYHLLQQRKFPGEQITFTARILKTSPSSQEPGAQKRSHPKPSRKQQASTQTQRALRSRHLSKTEHFFSKSDSQPKQTTQKKIQNKLTKCKLKSQF